MSPDKERVLRSEGQAVTVALQRVETAHDRLAVARRYVRDHPGCYDRRERDGAVQVAEAELVQAINDLSRRAAKLARLRWQATTTTCARATQNTWGRACVTMSLEYYPPRPPWRPHDRLPSMPGLLRLSPVGSEALIAAIQSSPLPATVPECVAYLLDVVVPLTKRTDLPAEDHAVLLAFCQSDDRLLNLARLMSRERTA